MNPQHTQAGVQTVATVDDDSRVDLLEYWNVLRERFWLIVAVAGGVLLLTLAATLLTTPIFRAGTTLQIERDTIQVVQVEGLTPTESPTDRDFYETQYELLRSRTLALRVIQDLRLTEHAEFAEAMEEFARDWAKRSGGGAPTRAEREVGLVAPLLDALTIDPVRNSRLVRVNFGSPDPLLAARVANAWADAFIASNLERRFDASSYATRYLEERLAQQKARLQDSEKALVVFSEQQQIVSIGEDYPSLSAQNLQDLNRALAAAQAERIRAESVWRRARLDNGSGLPQVVNDLLIQRLREQRATLAADYQQKLGTLKADYPDMQRAESQIAELDKQISAQVQYIVSAVESDYQSAIEQEALLLTQLAELKEDVLDLQGRSIEYNTLRREAETNRQLYDALLQRYKEIGVAGGGRRQQYFGRRSSRGAGAALLAAPAAEPGRRAVARHIRRRAASFVVARARPGRPRSEASRDEHWPSRARRRAVATVWADSGDGDHRPAVGVRRSVSFRTYGPAVFHAAWIATRAVRHQSWSR